MIGLFNCASYVDPSLDSLVDQMKADEERERVIAENKRRMEWLSRKIGMAKASIEVYETHLAEIKKRRDSFGVKNDKQSWVHLQNEVVRVTQSIDALRLGISACEDALKEIQGAADDCHAP